jgi:probable HAF family extracellular repeat protein
MKNGRHAVLCQIGLRIFVLTVGLATAFPNSSAASGLYAITDLGTFGGSQSSANAINNTGQIVGSADLGGTNTPHISHAFLYSGGVMNDLGVLGVYSNGTVVVSVSVAFGINNNGQIVGDSRTSSQAIHAFLYDQGQMTDLGTLPANTQSEARSINDNGQIVGWTLPAGPQHAFLYENGNMTDLGTLGGTASFAYCINNAGQFVGDSWTNTSGLSDIGYVYSNGVMTALGSLGVWPVIQALAINDSGQIVGYAGAVSTGGPTVTRGFLYSGGSFTDLGNLGGFYTNVFPNAINAGGQIVGTISGYETSVHAFLYSNGTMSDLNDLIDPGLGWTLLRASGINDNSQIVGSGINASFQTHGFLLTPRPALTNLRVSGGQAQFNLSGMTNVTYSVEYAASLPATNWTVLTNLSMTSSPAQIIDTANTNVGTRFYRAVQP